jgi:hypothetical protein
MSKLLTQQEARNYAAADDQNLVPAGDYRVKIVTVERMEKKPDTIQWEFKVMAGQNCAGRKLRAWTTTTPSAAWVLKRLVKDLIGDPATTTQEELEGRIVKAHVTIEVRSDNGESTNRVIKLSPWSGGGADEDAPAVGGEEDMPF